MRNLRETFPHLVDHNFAPIRKQYGDPSYEVIIYAYN